MKLSGFLLPAVAGLASAFDAAEFFLLEWHHSQRSIDNIRPPTVSKDAAQAILQQRLSLDWSLPTDSEGAISDIKSFGKPIQPLFHDAHDAMEPRQLVVVFKGTAEDLRFFARQSVAKDFVVNGMTSAYLPPIRNEHACAFEDVIDLKAKHCWGSKTQYLEYDVSKDVNALSTFEKSLDKLMSLADEGDMETMIVLLPSSDTGFDSESNNELRRRELGFAPEKVLSEDSASKSSSSGDQTDFNPLPFVAKKGPMPACFTSANACVTTTSKCSGHGQCVNKYEGSASECWTCHCMSTIEKENDRDVLYHWGGDQCQKIDVSTPFWLFAGFTVVIVGLVAGAIGLLFSVGEEKLPGVIGAGVSRSK